jgi:hypothetical protein
MKNRDTIEREYTGDTSTGGNDPEEKACSSKGNTDESVFAFASFAFEEGRTGDMDCNGEGEEDGSGENVVEFLSKSKSVVVELPLKSKSVLVGVGSTLLWMLLLVPTGEEDGFCSNEVPGALVR